MSEAATKTKRAEQQGGLLFLHAQTGLHPGSGTALGTVDLPIQRERHTQWPVIPGSTLKGILRDACRPAERNGQAREDWLAAFGPETEQAGEHAGALSVTDARILAFPVRSLKGVFAWVTCPAVLERLNRDLALLKDLGAETKMGLVEVPKLTELQFAVPEQGARRLVVGEDKVVLEEYEFTQERSVKVDKALVKVVENAVHPMSRGAVEHHLVILDDTWFTHFVRHATEVVARVGLDYERKTVKKGALFYEEFLPAETLFYSVVLASASRRPGHTNTAQHILGYLDQNMPPVLQVGGNETIGKGLCAVRLDCGKEG